MFGEHQCRTVQDMGWSGKKNGVLLELAEMEFDVLVTIDQGSEQEQNLAARRIVCLCSARRPIRSKIRRPSSQPLFPRSVPFSLGARFGFHDKRTVSFSPTR